MDYFEDYKSPDERSKQRSGFEKTKTQIKTERERAEELRNAIDNEKDL